MREYGNVLLLHHVAAIPPADGAQTASPVAPLGNVTFTEVSCSQRQRYSNLWRICNPKRLELPDEAAAAKAALLPTLLASGTTSRVVNRTWCPLAFFSKKVQTNQMQVFHYIRELMEAFAPVRHFHYNSCWKADNISCLRANCCCRLPGVSFTILVPHISNNSSYIYRNLLSSKLTYL